MRPEEMDREDWYEWIEYFADPEMVEEYVDEGYLEPGMSRDEVARAVADLVLLLDGFTLDRMPAYVFRQAVDKIYRHVNAYSARQE